MLVRVGYPVLQRALKCPVNQMYTSAPCRPVTRPSVNQGAWRALDGVSVSVPPGIFHGARPEGGLKSDDANAP